MKIKQVEELVLQALEHEHGGVKIYLAAIECAVNADLKKEWGKYLAETRTHVTALEGVCEAFGLDPKMETPGRLIVRHNGTALVAAMNEALLADDRELAELVACDCVVLAETKDHANWELLGKCADHLTGPKGEALKAACEVIEDQEDEHLYHSAGWCRELWTKALGMHAILPPLEEQRKVKTAIGAARAAQASEKNR